MKDWDLTKNMKFKEEKEFKYLTLVTCLICEREMTHETNWTMPLYDFKKTNPANLIIDVVDVHGIKQTTKKINLCDKHYREILEKIEEGGEINVSSGRSTILTK